MGLLGGIGLKAILAFAGAAAIASCGAYAIHSLKAAGAAEVALQVSQESLEAQDAARRKSQADVARLTAANTKLQGEAQERATALRNALSAIPTTTATDQCPENCLLRPLS